MPIEPIPQSITKPGQQARHAIAATAAAAEGHTDSCRSDLPERRTAPATAAQAGELRCRTIRSLTVEMLALSADRVRLRRDRRDSACKVRQIAMYVCHVALRMPMVDVGLGFGRDRTTVSHACHVIEDRRDEPQFDALVSAIERVATLIFPQAGGDDA